MMLMLLLVCCAYCIRIFIRIVVLVRATSAIVIFAVAVAVDDIVVPEDSCRFVSSRIDSMIGERVLSFAYCRRIIFDDVIDDLMVVVFLLLRCHSSGNNNYSSST